VNRGEIYKVPRPPNKDPKDWRYFVVVSRQTLLDSKAAHAVCAPINSEGHGLETEVQVGPEHGLQHISYINCDQLVRIEKGRLRDFVASLPASKLKALNTSLRVALDLE
jgi:mRNA-degrading endonuclease toxin of MazEF toxin-antitoxin module